jgi:GntR family transcriptional regulator
MTGTQADDLSVTTDYQETGAPESVARLLGVEPGTVVLVRTFRYAIAGTPHQVARSYLPATTAHRAGLTAPESERPGIGTIAQLLMAGIAVGRINITLETRMPSADETAALAIPPGTPIYEHWRVMYRQGEPTTPVEVSTAIVPGDRVAYVLDFDLAAEQ